MPEELLRLLGRVPAQTYGDPTNRSARVEHDALPLVQGRKRERLGRRAHGLDLRLVEREVLGDAVRRLGSRVTGW